MKLYYNEVDITKEVYINRCEHDTYAEKRADRLKIRFTDNRNLWNSWGPQTGDTIRYTNGAADTGKMYITQIQPQNGLITFTATSLPSTAGTKKSRVWEGFRLLEIGEDIAAEHGLTFESYGVTDRVYTYIKQANITDFEFLQYRCMLEGCAMIVYNGKLVMYDEQARESEAATKTIKIGEGGVYEYTDRSALSYGSVEFTFGDYSGVYYDSSANADRVLHPKTDIECTSNAEALRYARGILRDANKNAYTGWFRRKLTCDFAAGSVVNIETEKASAWDGKVLITHTRADYARGESKFFFRKPLEGY